MNHMVFSAFKCNLYQFRTTKSTKIGNQRILMKLQHNAYACVYQLSCITSGWCSICHVMINVGVTCN